MSHYCAEIKPFHYQFGNGNDDEDDGYDSEGIYYYNHNKSVDEDDGYDSEGIVTYSSQEMFDGDGDNSDSYGEPSGGGFCK